MNAINVANDIFFKKSYLKIYIVTVWIPRPWHLNSVEVQICYVELINAEGSISLVFVKTFASSLILIRNLGCCRVGFLEERMPSVCSAANKSKKCQHRQDQAVVCRDTWASWSAEVATEEHPATQANVLCFSAELFRQNRCKGRWRELCMACGGPWRCDPLIAT